MTRERLARAGVAALAVLALAWLGVMERDRRLLDSAIKLGGRIDSPADVRLAECRLRAAELLNPDTEPELARAAIYFGNERPRDAEVLLEQVLRAEPDNLLAWGRWFQVVKDTDPRRARRALDARRRLDPLGARGG